MKRFIILFLIFFASCGIKTESGYVTKILYPSNGMEVPSDFYILAATVKWKDTFIFNPFLFGRVSEINTEGMNAKFYIDGRLLFSSKSAKHHFLRLKLKEGMHTITVETERGKETITVRVKGKKSIFKRDDSVGNYIKNLKSRITKAVLSYVSFIDKSRFVTSDGYRLVNVVLSEKKVLLVWKKFVGYTSLFKFNMVDIKNDYSRDDFSNDFQLPDNLIYSPEGELYLTGLDINREGAVVSCGDGFLFRILREEDVVLYRIKDDGTDFSIVVSLYEYADKNDKLMTSSFKFPNYYHVACNREYTAIAYPVYSDYNLDYKLVVFKGKKLYYTNRLEDFDNFKLKIFLSEDGLTLFQRIPDRVVTTEKSKLFVVEEDKIKEVLFPMPFGEYEGINRAYVNIKGKYYPPKINLKNYNLGKTYIKVSIFGKSGFFSIKGGE